MLAEDYFPKIIPSLFLLTSSWCSPPFRNLRCLSPPSCLYSCTSLGSACRALALSDFKRFALCNDESALPMRRLHSMKESYKLGANVNRKIQI